MSPNHSGVESDSSSLAKILDKGENENDRNSQK